MSPRRRPPRDGQTWRTFVRNHSRELWACDFLTQYTATFTIAYVFVVMAIASRRIVHVTVTTAPTLAWVTQPLRNATPWGTTPRFLVHDNDAIDGQSPLTIPPPANGQLGALPVLGGLHHDYRLAASLAARSLQLYVRISTTRASVRR
jgi:hypothetical protein